MPRNITLLAPPHDSPRLHTAIPDSGLTDQAASVYACVCVCVCVCVRARVCVCVSAAPEHDTDKPAQCLSLWCRRLYLPATVPPSSSAAVAGFCAHKTSTVFRMIRRTTAIISANSSRLLLVSNADCVLCEVVG